jgi:reactive intermediate/imine deaminase
MKETFGHASVGGKSLPLSEAVRAGDFVFASGQLPFRDDGSLDRGSVEEQTRRVLENLRAALAKAGATLDDVVKTTVWLTDRADFAGFNTVYAEFFPCSPPARAAVVAALVLDARVEVEAVAFAPRG